MEKNKKSKVVPSKLERVEESEMPRLQVNPEILKNLKSQNQAKQQQELDLEMKQKKDVGQDALYALKFFVSGTIFGVLGYFLLPYLWKKYNKRED